MKIFSIVLVSVGLAFCVVGNSRAQQNPTPSGKSLVLSLPPAELIRLLPPPPENW